MDIPSIDWLPGESFYGLCCRLHRLLGCAKISTTSQLLFSHLYRGFEHDFPKRLTNFVVNSGQKFGSQTSIVLNHTIAPYYLIFRGGCEGKVGDFYLDYFWHRQKLKNNKCILAHPLKFCLECGKAEEAEFGVSYWHVMHQLPCVWVCEKHHTLLVVYRGARNSWGQYGVVFPDAEMASAIDCDYTLDIGLLEQLLRAATDVWLLGSLTNVNARHLPRAYRALASSTRFGGDTRTINLEVASCSLYSFFTRIRSVLPFINLPMDIRTTKKFLRGVLWPVTPDYNPSHLCIMSCWLDEGVKNVIAMSDELMKRS
ncbi:TniQ [compost metagenome]|uniref:TniQ family protein n=1 Tax=Pseudomonas fluorescens TaxID=294 RepID=UPI001241FD33|nr:TniQ family protein [Pseudomonas fluorescens]VVQ24283.1 hypothetical protein PS934_05665 [Pseudomonas fluorescens]